MANEHVAVLNLYSVLINKFLVMEFIITVKVSHKLDFM